jgi:hypothetical protein
MSSCHAGLPHWWPHVYRIFRERKKTNTTDAFVRHLLSLEKMGNKYLAAKNAAWDIDFLKESQLNWLVDRVDIALL